MAYTNHLLFNNIFLKNLRPSDEEIASANYLVHESARDWYRNADFSSPQNLVETWIRPLLNQQTLDLVEANPNVWYLVAPWEREIPLAVCFVVGERQNLGGFDADGNLPKGQHWMIQAVDQSLQKPELNLRWVVLTNGDQWRLLDAHNLRKYEAFLEIDLVDLLKGQDDRLAAYLFHRLLRLEDSMERDESTGINKLDAFLNQSIQATEATEKYLKTGVSDNLNTPGGGDGIMAQLCMGLVHAIDPSGKKSFNDEERDEIYRNATYLLYRLLFILYAEARNLLPMDRDDYQAISLNRLVDDAWAVHLNPGNNALQQTNLWDQLNTLFSAIQYSDEYMGIPPYNGGLFENDDKAYLENYKIANRFLAEALVELAYLSDSKGEKAVERIDYRDLSVRHLGSLYEGMIEYRLFIAEEELLARRDKDGKVKYLSAETTERKPNDEVMQKGKVYFAQSPHERKATGTHYTAEDLVERLVKQTVLRLLNERWQEFEPKFSQWLAEIDATPGEAERRRLQARVDSELEQFVETEVLSMRVCDPAMGSGHFLVHIAHRVTNFIIWTLARTAWPNDNTNLDADIWRKRVVENCLYGVDINQMAVELAKLSLWLATMQLGQPLSFLDHHLKQGNSLLGASLEEIENLLKQDDFSKPTAKSTVAEAKGQYLLLQQVRSLQQKIGEANTLLQKIASKIVNRAEDIHQQEFDYEEVEKILAPYKRIGDLIVAQKMGLKIPANEIHSLAKAHEDGNPLNNTQASWQSKARAMLSDMSPLHWGLEFPMLFWAEARNGFNIIIGNPPFLGGLKISGAIGGSFLQFLKTHYSPSKSTSDLCAYFFRRAYNLTTIGSFVGLIATNTIGEGETRDTGLAVLVQKGGKIVFTEKNLKWRGEANLEVNLVVLQSPISSASQKKENITLDGKVVDFISSRLDESPESEAVRLKINESKAFEGTIARGIGFALDLDEAFKLFEQNPKNADCLRPYLSGEDINKHPEQKPNRYVICFYDWPIEKAAEYPDLLKIVEERVKPYRMSLKPISSDYRKLREKWWLFARPGIDLKKSTSHLSKLLARSIVSEFHALAFVPNNMIFSNSLVLFAFDDFHNFALLQSSIHLVWIEKQGSSLESRHRYVPNSCFDKFPFPKNKANTSLSFLALVGEKFYKAREEYMVSKQIGLTDFYNLFHDSTYTDFEIKMIREVSQELDCRVLECYGWNDIDLEHDFYPNDRKKIRFMPSPAAQREIFTRLISLNQEIAAQEAAQGLVVEAEEVEEIDGDSEN